ncbi:ImmA/IrrE family metallo-endopeptidase [Methylobacterium sp. J-030]|uniref:ImmA/IrrE family metallo-endopeptidase n=1 Tax=Methylobacterium sp. J-030 TaxID=2836627 RepID=UPI001FBA60BE|nr:ImmA/IrrE family metallo-endopeptidase [Methylobacterium sp. J-030]MCJ2072888.1 ImmA/IrrE family metallo-endopeptidase [Methylobacterium sp. J-030]
MGSLNSHGYSEDDLQAVFGPASQGMIPEDRAATSDRVFVRSQVQITFDNERAKGRKIAAPEALSTFGWEILLNIAREGATTLVQTIDEPAITIRKRRTDLNLDQQQVARHLNLPLQVIAKAEIAGELSKIRDLEKICQLLSIDERSLGMVRGGHSDKNLAVRLRTLSDDTEHFNFTPTSVMNFSEAAWVISRQDALAKKLNSFSNERNVPVFQKDNNYSHPAWKQGFRLAAITREKLGISADEPIEKLRHIVDTKLDISLIQQKFSSRFAGATLANGECRGIVINEEGANSHVWIRRMTLCHELGHLLWDPDQRLNQLKVDHYNRIDSFDFRRFKDPVEERANAFAVAFLAPPIAVEKIVEDSSSILTAISKLMRVYGISASAAKRHIQNVTRRKTDQVSAYELPFPSDDWIGRENFTLDWFPAKSTPLSRRGKFAWIVALALQRKKISSDSAAMFLNIAPEEAINKCHQVLDAYTDTE